MASASPARGPLDINQNIRGGRTAVLTIILVLWRQPQCDVTNVARFKMEEFHPFLATGRVIIHFDITSPTEWGMINQKKMNKIIYYIIDYNKGAVLFWQRTIWLPLYTEHTCLRASLCDRCVISIQTSLFREEHRHSQCCHPLSFV